MRRTRGAAGAAAAATAVLALAGCGGGGSAGADEVVSGASSASAPATPGGGAAEEHADEDKPQGEITVFAATPLKKAFLVLGRGFEKAHPGVAVGLRFGESAALAAAIDAEGSADVFATGEPSLMQPYVDAGSVARAPATFARDRAGEYVIAPLADSFNIVTAAAFVDYVVSAKGDKALEAAGFELV